MAAQEATLISGQTPKAAADELTAASATATSCYAANEQLQQVVDIRSSQQETNNNNSTGEGEGEGTIASQELKKATKNAQSSYVGGSKQQNAAAGKCERLSSAPSSKDRGGEKRSESDKHENGIENDDELTSSSKLAISAQSSRDKTSDHRAEIANNTATQTGDKQINPDQTGTNKDSNKKPTQQQHTIIECGRNKQTRSNEQVNSNNLQDSVKYCASVAPVQIDENRKERTTVEEKESSEINQVSLIKSNDNNNNNNNSSSSINKNKPTFVQKYTVHNNLKEATTEDFLNQTTIITTSNLNNITFSASKQLDQPEQEFGCKRRRLSYLQSLLLRKWPCLAIAICIMSSLLFGMLLSALTVYLMHGVTDCSSYALAATRVGHPLITSEHERPSDFGLNTPIELASLTGHELHASGSRLYASGLTSRSNSSEKNDPAADGHKFRRLPGTLWPIHYDLFIQPYILEPHFNFSGKVSIRIKCTEPTSNITLHTYELELNDQTLSLKQASNSAQGNNNNNNNSVLAGHQVPKVKGVSSIKELQYSIIQLDSPLEAGQEYVLGIDFVGWLNDDLAGFYKIKYERKNSTETTYSTIYRREDRLNKHWPASGDLNISNSYNNIVSSDVMNEFHWIAATQFQATDARRAFPCFDEPLYKATFSIQIKHWKNMTALSNMPIIDRQDSPDGLWVTDTFAKTHRMSTYLVAFAVTDFESRSEGNISVWARPGFAHSAEYALKIAGKILRHYEDFFGIEYPLPKMDMIALPDFNAGAMENWGLITYRETAMLYDETTSSIGNKLRVAVVVAHELAHQWFGNLVTPKWWDDLWLNEGFASYVEYIGVDFVEPTWRMLDQFVVDEVQNVFSTDSLSSSHQISIPVNNPDEISEIFDHISYAKGASIIRMMNHFLTEDVFKAGLRRYLKALKYSNAEQSDLWAHLTEAQSLANRNRSIPGGAVDVEKVMNSWTLQTGYPVVTLERSYDNSKEAKLDQVRYSESSFANRTSSILSKSNITSPKTSNNERWEIPITFTSKSELNWEPRTRLWMHQNDSKAVQLSKSLVPKDDEWMLVNIRQVGYYRVNYDLQNWKMLINQLNTDHTLITPTNRAQILDDLFEFARAGLIDYEFAMDATKYLKNEFDYLPWETVLGSFAYIDEMLSRTSLYGDWREYVANLIAPIYKRYQDKDWTISGRVNNRLLTGKSDDSSNKTSPDSEDLLDIYNQMNANAWACEVNEHCQQKARSLFNDWKRTGKNLIRPEHRFVTYCTAIEHGNRSDWDFLWKTYESEQNASEKDRLMKALGCTKELWLLARYLEWTFDKTKPIRRQDGAFVFRMIAKNPYGHDIAFNFMRDRWSTIKEYYGKSSFSLGNLIRSITVSMSTQIELNELLVFYESVKSDVGTGKRSFQNAIEEVDGNVLWRNRNYKKIQNWLQDGRRKKTVV